MVSIYVVYNYLACQSYTHKLDLSTCTYNTQVMYTYIYKYIDVYYTWNYSYTHASMHNIHEIHAYAHALKHNKHDIHAYTYNKVWIQMEFIHTYMPQGSTHMTFMHQCTIYMKFMHTHMH